MSSEPKKVLFFVPSLMGGGAERVFATLLRHIDRNCFELHLGVLHSEGKYLEDLPRDVVVHDLDISRVRYAVPAIIRLIRKIKPRTVISTLRHMNVSLILSKPFLPRNTKIIVREAAFASRTLENETDYPQIWGWLYGRLYKYTDHIVVLSDAMMTDLVENFKVPVSKIVRIYNPVDSQRIRELAQLGENPYCGSGPHLVAAGRLTREKGFDVLLDALPAVIRHFPSAEVAILGEGPLREELTGQAQKLGLLSHLRFPGFDRNPWRYFRHADLFILPSRYEGLPNVLLEALTVGTRVVATDCPGGVREIQACAPEMILSLSENPDALAQAIISACDEGRNGNRARSAPDLSRFDLQRVLDEYSRLF